MAAGTLQKCVQMVNRFFGSWFLRWIETGWWCFFYIQLDEKMRIKQKKKGVKNG